MSAKANLFIIFFVAVGSAFGQMTNNYSYYTSNSYSNATATGAHLTTTVVVQGTASYPYSCTYCYSAWHYARVLNQLTHGTTVTGGWSSGYPVNPPNSYINYTSTQNQDILAGEEWWWDSDTEVHCTVAGTIWHGGPVTIKFRLLSLLSSDCFHTNPVTHLVQTFGGWGDPNNLLACTLSDAGPELPAGGVCYLKSEAKNCYDINDSNGNCHSYCPGFTRTADKDCVRFTDNFPLVETVTPGLSCSVH